MNLHEIAARLDKATIRGDELTACCPAHPDRNPSLSGSVGDDGRVLLHCFAGCDLDAITHALGIDPADLFPEPEQPANRPSIVRTYAYTDEDGKVLFEVVRFQPKSFRQRQPDGKGGWVWNLKGIDSKPLFHLPAVIKAIEGDHRVFLCEGEKDAERLQAALTNGDVATTIAGGAGKWRAEHTDALWGANVVIIADRDGPGRRHADEVAAALKGVAASVRTQEPLEGKDAFDHLAAGHGIDDFQPLTRAEEEAAGYDDAPAHTDADNKGWDDPWDIPAVTAYTKPLVAPTTDDEEEHTSWWPVDLAALFDGTAEILVPTLFARDDGQHILYPGKAHAFNGESESGKSWAALLACLQAIGAGHNVLYVDFEDTAPTVVARLLALGAKPVDVVARFTYLAPHEPLIWRDKITAGGIDLAVLLESHPFALAILDGVTEAMTMHGLDINSNNDVATFYNTLPRRLKQTGSATVQIDHIPKNRDNRGRGGIGGQHKLAGIDVSFIVEATAPFGIGRHGVAKLSIEKDRPGQLRQHASGRRIAELHLDSDPATHALAASLRVPEGAPQQADHWQPTVLMESVSDFIRDCNAVGHHPSQNDIESGVSGKAENIRKAIAELVRTGYVGRGLDGRRKHEHTLITPYEANEDAA